MQIVPASQLVPHAPQFTTSPPPGTHPNVPSGGDGEHDIDPDGHDGTHAPCEHDLRHLRPHPPQSKGLLSASAQ